ncbi:hypothetical protein VTI74DRAFT_298 [Chaetomium olivicolor]
MLRSAVSGGVHWLVGSTEHVGDKVEITASECVNLQEAIRGRHKWFVVSHSYSLPVRAPQPLRRLKGDSTLSIDAGKQYHVWFGRAPYLRSTSQPTRRSTLSKGKSASQYLNTGFLSTGTWEAMLLFSMHFGLTIYLARPPGSPPSTDLGRTAARSLSYFSPPRPLQVRDQGGRRGTTKEPTTASTNRRTAAPST